MAWGGPVWGIFDQNGGPVIVADSVFGVEVSNDFRISDYPQEQGAFESYNKVKVPYQAKVTFIISGDIAKKNGFLTNLEAALASLALFTVVTPEFSYANANLIHYGYSRIARQGAQMIRVDVWCEEVRIASQAVLTSNFTNTQSTNGAATTNDGAVQPVQTGPDGASSQSVPDSPTPNLTAGPGPSSGEPGNLTLTSNIGPNFYNPSGLPQVPTADTSTWGTMTPDQQATAVNYGSSNGASLGAVSPPDASGNVTATYDFIEPPAAH